MLHLNPKVQQYDGFTPGRRVFGRTPKMPIEAACNPNFRDFADRKDPPSTKTHQAFAMLWGIRNASLEIDFQGKSNLSLHRRVLNMGKRRILFYDELYITIAIMAK